MFLPSRLHAEALMVFHSSEFIDTALTDPESQKYIGEVPAWLAALLYHGIEVHNLSLVNGRLNAGCFREVVDAAGRVLRWRRGRCVGVGVGRNGRRAAHRRRGLARYQVCSC